MTSPRRAFRPFHHACGVVPLPRLGEDRAPFFICPLWGKWLGAPSRRDEGGSRARASGRRRTAGEGASKRHHPHSWLCCRAGDVLPNVTESARPASVILSAPTMPKGL